MFELSVALRYLLPKKRALSTSLISIVSVMVISLVVWLVLVFLSVTRGIEENWLNKLTSVNAPIRLSPTSEYYSSYYYQIDQISSLSGYSFKTIGEKKESSLTDPYQEDFDQQIPPYWRKADRKNTGEVKDLVKSAYETLSDLKKQFPQLAFQDYEVSSALMRLYIRNSASLYSEKTNVLSQMTYLLSMTEENPRLSSLIIPPSIEDLNYLLDRTDQKKNLFSFFTHANIEKVTAFPNFIFSIEDLNPSTSFSAYIDKESSRLIIPTQLTNKPPLGFEKGELFFEKGCWIFLNDHKEKLPLDHSFFASFDESLILKSKIDGESLKKANFKDEIQCLLETMLQGKSCTLKTFFSNLSIQKASPKIQFEDTPETLPLWAYSLKNVNKTLLPELPSNKIGVLLPKVYQKTGAFISDQGEILYQAISATSSPEQKIFIQVVGFYDPGILPIGSRCLLVPSSITQTINATIAAVSPDGSPTNGIFVWFEDLAKADLIKDKIQQSFLEKGIFPYWKISTYKEFEFSKDLMEQFQSDRTLFTLIATIILIVACCNIVSLLVLLVNNKKKEIAILQAMGAKRRSIAIIFGLCGVIMGTASSLLGMLFAVLTLKNMNVLIYLLSKIQGHNAFNPTFFGDTLPSTLSVEALLFVLITTPILSLLAGIIPAIKASRIAPSSVLRSL